MKIDFLTLFPEMFEGVLHSSILKKHRRKKLSHFKSSILESIRIISIKQWMTIRMAAVLVWY